MPHLQTQGRAKAIFLDHISDINELELAPHEFVCLMMDAWDAMASRPDRSIHGNYFEFVVGETLAQRGIDCLYYQADVRHVPLAKFDWFLYHETHPVSISCKTKARDRWKQAAYEAMALKQVYVNAVNYLVTIEEISRANEKLALNPLSIDHYVIANKPEYDEALDRISQRRYSEALDVSPVRGGRLVVIE